MTNDQMRMMIYVLQHISALVLGAHSIIVVLMLKSLVGFRVWGLGYNHKPPSSQKLPKSAPWHLQDSSIFALICHNTAIFTVHLRFRMFSVNWIPAGMIALKETLAQLPKDHANARLLAEGDYTPIHD